MLCMLATCAGGIGALLCTRVLCSAVSDSCVAAMCMEHAILCLWRGSQTGCCAVAITPGCPPCLPLRRLPLPHLSVAVNDAAESCAPMPPVAARAATRSTGHACTALAHGAAARYTIVDDSASRKLFWVDRRFECFAEVATLSLVFPVGMIEPRVPAPLPW